MVATDKRCAIWQPSAGCNSSISARRLAIICLSIPIPGPSLGNGHFHFTPLATAQKQAYIGAMTYIINKPVLAFTAFTFAAGLAADAVDGAVDHDFNGPLKIIEALASATSSGPAFVPSPIWVEDQIIGGGYEAIAPGNQHVGKPLLDYSRTGPLDQPQPLLPNVQRPFGSTGSTLSPQVTDTTSGSVVLRGWHPRST